MRHTPLHDTDPVKVSNLKTLASYLATLPADYEQFDMANFAEGPYVNMGVDEDGDIIPGRQCLYPAQSTEVCGAVCCALGHGPAAGIPALKADTTYGYESWQKYQTRVFNLYRQNEDDTDTDEWVWCFGPGWTRVDNTPLGAAKRISYMLEHGTPANSNDQSLGTRPLCYLEQVV